MNRYEITKGRLNRDSYAVCMLTLPSFPSDLPLKDVVRGNGYAIVAAGDLGGEWGFITLSLEEKVIIGDQISELDANTWLWCTEWVS